MKPILQYECKACGEFHETEDYAAECSCHGIIEWFRCPVCDDHFRRREECEECISSHDEAPSSIDAPVVTAEELEAAGQQRLIP
jgi:hypothetical protein